jgi:hypothetical protein
MAHAALVRLAGVVAFGLLLVLILGRRKRR